MKKLLSVFLVAGMLLAMVACGGAPASSGTASGSAAASGSGGSAEPSGKLVIYSPNSDTQVAVSYTHLDVYKRQELRPRMLPPLCGEKRQLLLYSTFSHLKSPV